MSSCSTKEIKGQDMGYIYYRKGVGDLRHLRRDSVAADGPGGLTALPPPPPAHESSTSSLVLTSHLEALISKEVPRPHSQLVARLPILIKCMHTIPGTDGSQRKQTQEAHMSLIGRLHRATAEDIADLEDPWRRVLARALPPDMVCISSVGLTDLLGIAPSTGNCRRIARAMRSLGWLAVKSRQLAPGGSRGTECRGWCRPVRQARVRQPRGHVKGITTKG